MELRRRFPDLRTCTKSLPGFARPAGTPRHTLISARRNGLLLIDTAVFTLVQAATAWRARRQFAAGQTIWERDHSTRAPSAPAT